MNEHDESHYTDDPETTCSLVEEWLLSGSQESANDKGMRHHLSVCELCQDFKRQLDRFSGALEPRLDEPVYPDPAIHSRLRSAFDSRRNGPLIIRFLRKPVPMYRVLLAAAAVVAVVLIKEEGVSASDRPLDIQVRESELTQIRNGDGIDVPPVETRGRNHAEDSLLVSLAVQS